MKQMLEQAAMDMMAPVQSDPPLNPFQRQQWNNFVDYLEKQGYRGSTLLDDKNTDLGNTLMAKFRVENPGFTLTYPDVKQIQQDLQDYRQKSLEEIHSGKATFDGPDEKFMPGLSKPDGWLGSKTATYKFPNNTTIVKKQVSGLTGEDSRLNPSTTTVQNMNQDWARYQAAQYKAP